MFGSAMRPFVYGGGLVGLANARKYEGEEAVRRTAIYQCPGACGGRKCQHSVLESPAYANNTGSADKLKSSRFLQAIFVPIFFGLFCLLLGIGCAWYEPSDGTEDGIRCGAVGVGLK